MTPRTVACQVPQSMGFSTQENWSGLPRSPPGDLPNPGMELTSLTSPALAGRFFTTSAIWEDQQNSHININQMLHKNQFRGPKKKKGGKNGKERKPRMETTMGCARSNEFI